MGPPFRGENLLQLVPHNEVLRLFTALALLRPLLCRFFGRLEDDAGTDRSPGCRGAAPGIGGSPDAPESPQDPAAATESDGNGQPAVEGVLNFFDIGGTGSIGYCLLRLLVARVTTMR